MELQLWLSLQAIPINLVFPTALGNYHLSLTYRPCPVVHPNIIWLMDPTRTVAEYLPLRKILVVLKTFRVPVSRPNQHRGIRMTMYE